MKPKFLLYILIMCTALFSCDKMPANGDLDGMWQIMEIEEGGKTTDMKLEQVYMSIQLKLFQLGDKLNGRRYYGYFERTGDTMHFWQFSYASLNESAADDNTPIKEENVSLIHPYGFRTIDERFTIEKLTKDLLILRNDSVRIRYIKF